MAMHLRTSLVVDALEMAIAQRRPDAVIHQSDQGCQGGFNRSSQRLNGEELRWEHRHVDGQTVRDVAALPSPGRPTAGRRENRQRFWEAIAGGLSSEEAAVAAGVSQPVGTRWFRQSGGMPPISLAPLSGRYLSFAEREDIAILHAQHVGIRDIARRVSRSPSTISRELRRNAATRSGGLAYRATTAQWHADRKAKRPQVAKLAAHDGLRQYVHDRLAGLITAADGKRVPGPDGALEWSPSRSPPRPTLGDIMES